MNWDGKQERRLVETVRGLVNRRQRFRPLGGRHSVTLGSILLNTNERDVVGLDITRFVDAPTFDRQNQTMWCSSGATLGALRTFLVNQTPPMRLFGTPEADNITVGGACSMSTHGTGASTFASHVVTYRLIDARGELFHFVKEKKGKEENETRREEEGGGEESFSNMLITHGLCGVLLRVQVRVYPAHNIEETSTLFNAIPNDLVERIEHEAQKSDKTHLFVTFGPFSKRAMLTVVDESDKQPTFWRNAPWSILYKSVSINWLAALSDGMIKNSKTLSKLASESTFNLPKKRVRKRSNYFDVNTRFGLLDLAYSIPLRELPACYERLQAVIDDFMSPSRLKKDRVYVTYRFFCRLLRPDYLFHSLAEYRSHEFNGINKERKNEQKEKLRMIFDILVSKSQPNVRAFALAIDNVFRRFGGRPHHGKAIVTLDSLRRAYDWTLLKSLHERHDPSNLLVPNECIAALLLLSTHEENDENKNSCSSLTMPFIPKIKPVIAQIVG